MFTISDLNNLQEIIIKQKEIMIELEKEAKLIIHSDLAQENQALKNEVENLQNKLNSMDGRLKQISMQNSSLKNALHEQIYSEKLRLIGDSNKKRDIYFKSSLEGELNALSKLEYELNGRINYLVKELIDNRINEGNEIYSKLNLLHSQVSQLVTEARTITARETDIYSKESTERFKELKNQQITDEVIESIGKKNNFEAFIGGNLINKLGILFIILGIIAVSRFTFFRLPDEVKGIIMFLVSGGFLAVGEWLNRKKANVFSLGITSGGVAGLYVSLTISHFGLDIISIYPAIVLCLLITLGAFVLSQRYNSQTIAAFALIGGYIPIVSIADSSVRVYSAMVYFILLNLLALTFSFYKKWKITMFIGYFLNLIGTIYIVSELDGIIMIPYVIFSFAIYTIIPIISNYRLKQQFSKADIVVLGLNTVFSSIIMYVVFIILDLEQLHGVMAIAFAIIYLCLGRFIEKNFASDKTTLALFYLTGLTFVVLVVPFQFGAEYLTLGWLVQGVLMSVYGILANQKIFKRVGFVISALCLFVFVYFDLYLGLYGNFEFKYLSVTLGSIIILWALAYKKSLVSELEKAYKYTVVLNFWFYSLYLVSLFNRNDIFDFMLVNPDFLVGSMAVTVTFLISFILPRIHVLADKGIKIISLFISIMGMISLLVVTSTFKILPFPLSIPMYITVTTTLVLVVISGLAVLTMRNVLMFLSLEAKMPVEWLPFGVSAYFLVILSQNLITQYGLEFTSIAISIIYVVAALAWIIYGFTKRYAFMRRFGLGLSVLAVAKLFLVDLPQLTEGYDIVSYFAFGITLLGISFVYQYFSKAITAKMEVTADDSQDDL